MAETRLTKATVHQALGAESVGLAVGFAAMCMCATLAFGARVESTNIRASGALSVRQIAARVPSPQALRFASLGHTEAVADLMWLNALSFFGANFAMRHDPDWLDPHFEAISTLDPRYVLVYEWAGTAVMYGGEINNAAVMASNRILEQGVERFPWAWNLHFMLGVNYAAELTPSSPEEAIAWRRRGGEYIARAAQLPNAPAYLTVVAQSFLRDTAEWAFRYDQLADTVLWQQTPLEISTTRAHLRILVGPPRSEPLIARALVLQALAQDERTATLPGGIAIASHPDPDYVATVDDVVAP